MKAARLIVLGVAVAAGGLAALLAGGSDRSEPPPPAPVVQIDTTDVLVAKNDINIGQALSEQDVQWQAWPTTAAAGPAFLRKTERPDALTSVIGAVARAPISAGEPVRENKLIKAGGSGFMAAILPSGMRAISTEISPETGAGGFILPNDRVDVLLTRRDREAERMTGFEQHISETILSDVRVLAIDQTVEEKDGQRVVVGKTATLELSPREAETLALSRQMGTLTLALRSLVDADPNRRAVTDDKDEGRNRLNLVRFGVTSTAITK